MHNTVFRGTWMNRVPWAPFNWKSFMCSMFNNIFAFFIFFFALSFVACLFWAVHGVCNINTFRIIIHRLCAMCKHNKYMNKYIVNILMRCTTCNIRLCWLIWMFWWWQIENIMNKHQYPHNHKQTPHSKFSIIIIDIIIDSINAIITIQYL